MKSQQQVPVVNINDPLKIDELEYNLDSGESKQERKDKLVHFFSLLFFLAIFCGSIAFAYFFAKENSKISVTPEPSAQTSPSTPKPVFSRKNIFIEVRNASGKTGYATFVSDSLVSLGYASVTSRVKVNKEAATKIFLNPQAKIFSENIISDIKTIIHLDIEALPLENSTASALLVIGNDFKK